MKIVLTGAEKESIRDFAGMLGLNMKDANKALIVESEDGSTTVNVVPEFVTEYMDLLMKIAPMLKGVYSHAMGTFQTICVIGDMFDKKWSDGQSVRKEVE